MIPFSDRDKFRVAYGDQLCAFTWSKVTVANQSHLGLCRVVHKIFVISLCFFICKAQKQSICF